MLDKKRYPGLSDHDRGMLEAIWWGGITALVGIGIPSFIFYILRIGN